MFRPLLTQHPLPPSESNPLVPDLGPAELVEAALLRLDDESWRQIDLDNVGVDDVVGDDPLVRGWEEKFFGGE